MEIQMADGAAELDPNEQFTEMNVVDISQAMSGLSLDCKKPQSVLVEGGDLAVASSQADIQPAEQNHDQNICHEVLYGSFPVVFLPDAWEHRLGEEIGLAPVNDGVGVDFVHQTLYQCAGFAVTPDLEGSSFRAKIVGASHVGLPSLGGEITVATSEPIGPPNNQSEAFETRGVDAWAGDAVCMVGSQSGGISVGGDGLISGGMGNGGLPFDPELASVLLEAESGEAISQYGSVVGDMTSLTNAQIARAIRKVKLNAMREKQGKKKPKKSRSKKRAHVLKPGILTLIPYGMDEQTTWTHRICMFTARMRAVLGDRRMSVPWGGSILDSVAGVFLTQNVSDTSSSKAFMNIAARFPSRNLPRYGTKWNRQDILQDDPVDFNSEIEPLALWNARDCSDMVDWMGIHNTDESVLADCIKCRGMQHTLAARIKKFLGRIAEENLEGWWKEKKRKEEELKKQIERGKERLEAAEQERLFGPNSLHGVISRLEHEIFELDGSPSSIPTDGEAIIAVNAAEVQVIPIESPRREAGSKKEIKATDGSIGGRMDCMGPPPKGPVAGVEAPGGVTRMEQGIDIVPSSDDEMSDWGEYFRALVPGNAGDQNVEIGVGLEGEEIACDVSEVLIVLDDCHGEEEPLVAEQGKDFDGRVENQSEFPCMNKATLEGSIEGAEDAKGWFVGCKEGSLTGGGGVQEVDCDGEIAVHVPVPEFEKRIVVPDEMIGGKKGSKQKDSASRKLPFDKLSMDWLHSLPDEEVVEYLTSSVEGLGRKSASCVMLLCMGRKDFPVDVNVARICARLGWIPLETVGNIEELDEYAPEEEVHKYLHKRIMHFDFATLYELHYQMITLGKVFCTKRAPRCGYCPLRDVCEYSRYGGRRFDPSSMKPPKRKRKPFKKNSPPRKSPASSQGSPQKNTNSPPQSEGYETPRRSAKIEACQAKQAEALGIFSAASGVGPGHLTPNRMTNLVPTPGGEYQTPARVGSSLPDVEDLAGPMSPPPPPSAKRNQGSSPSGVPISLNSEEVLGSSDGVRDSVGSNQRSSAGKTRSSVCESVGLPVEKNRSVGGDASTASRIEPGSSKPNLSPAPHQHTKSNASNSMGQQLAEDVSHGGAVSAMGESTKTAGDQEVERIMELVENMPEESTSVLGAPELADAMDLCRSELILGLEESQRGDHRAAKKRYHKISMLIHPDKCSNADAGRAFAAVSEALQVATGETDDEFLTDLGMDDYGDDVRQAAEDCDKTNELIIHPGPPTQSHTRRVFFAIMGVGKLLNPIIQLGFPPRIAEDPNPYFLLPDPRVFPVDARADSEDLMTARWDILPYLKEGRQDIPFLILTPSRTAMKGKFPLNGTFFQVNELFLSDIPAVYIPIADLMESKPKWRPVYFGSSVSHMSMGMQTREVAQMFHFGFVCNRGIEKDSNHPTPLPKFLMP
ncbi:hypothetical protein BSKO_11122 [Bryopsis sp. KO-2023]|nr:hypothetical protein BSKO_11122 [Bryopsis sp. KO-2023]